MNRTHILALSGALAAALELVSAAAQEAAKDGAADPTRAVACYGIAAAGENDCAVPGQNACAGQAGTNFDGRSFRLTTAKDCEALGGAPAPFDGVNPKKKPA